MKDAAREQAWNAGMTEEEYDAARAAENLAELTHPELQGPEWHLDRNDSYHGYQQAGSEPADKYRDAEGGHHREPEDELEAGA